MIPLLNQKEFTKAGSFLLGVMTTPTYHKMSQEERTQVFNKFVGMMSETTLAIYIDTVLENVNINEEECRKYDKTEEQTKSITDRIPRLEGHSESVYEKVEINREFYGLK